MVPLQWAWQVRAAPSAAAVERAARTAQGSVASTLLGLAMNSLPDSLLGLQSVSVGC